MSNLELMQSILDYRKTDKTFQKSIDQKSSALQYRFFDGPPFASGTPHYGHLLAGSIKDVVPRYMAMRGYQVKRKRGRDCHGLPVEKAVEKALGIDGKRDIEEKIWVEAFVEHCRAYVNQTNEDWHWFIDHTGRWVDFENPYFTMDLDFMESVMRCFSTIYNQNKVYRGFKVQGYCPSCATPLANNEISEGYEDRQDTAITVKFPLQNQLSDQYSTSEDGFIDVVAGVIKDCEGRYAMIHHAKENLRFFPGGKVEKGETFELALSRELKEEVGIQVESTIALGAIKIIHLGKPYRVHRFEVKTQDTPTLQEAEKHNALQRVKEENADNSLGFALNIDGNIIDDERELLHDFIDFHLFKKVLDPQDAGLFNGNFNFLAWTTTPWTLPSNMFLAIGEDIEYVTVYDPASQEYFVLAENLLKKFFKSPDQYKFIYKQKGKELKNLTYQPLFDVIKNSNIDAKYQSQMFHITTADFVSTEDGTGIVHIAPSFGIDDFNVVANILGGEHALEWIFMPVDEYGTFDHQVPAFQGQKVMEANKPIIDHLKAENKVVKVESLNHSYPHCRRCKTPLIYKAMSSWFIKEQEMNAQTNTAAQTVNFTPASVKNRFVNGLASAPDWNVARNRYRGSPLPIWQNVEDADDHFAITTLDELYHFTKTGSKNLTKNLFIRHGRTDFNEEHKFDGLGDARLNQLGHQQAQELVNKMQSHLTPDAELVFIISPLPRTWQTIKPTLIAYFGAEEAERCEKLYFEHYEQHRARFLAKEAKEYIQKSDDETLVIRLNDQLFIDNRITDLVSYASQALPIKCDAFNRADESKPVGLDGEDIKEYYERNKRAVHYWNKKCPNQTLIYVSHDDTIRLMRKVFRNFEYGKYRAQYKVANAEIKLHYRDNERNAEVDLHKPYVDAYRGIKDGKTYKRIPEVLDCWFESGSMPFWQDHYLGDPQHQISYPADFIAEGLDQTRGWFRSLHVVGHAIKRENAFKNVIVNGLVLAEDGKKMSKSLKNYPDPRMLIEKRGGDAFRLYTLSSPVVRAEPMRFAERGVEQVFKDFNIPLENVFKFFETYAKIDQWKSDGTQLFAVLDQLDLDSLDLKEQLARIVPDCILAQDETLAQSLQNLASELTGKQVKILICSEDSLTSHIAQNAGKTLFLCAWEALIKNYREQNYGNATHRSFSPNQILKLPTYQIANELDRWILAELHQCLLDVDTGLRAYNLDGAIKTGIDFMEKLSNRYLRRSRRRFRENGMTADKNSAYATIYEVLTSYLQIMAPFTPFITEHIWQKMHNFSQKTEIWSVHLSAWPFAHENYIDQQLMQEIATVRRAIKLALFIRSKNKIAVKQPLQSLQIKFE